MKGKKIVLFSIVLFSLLFLLNNVSFSKIFSLPDKFYVSYDEVAKSNLEKDFGKLVGISLKNEDVATGQDKTGDGEMLFKLFGFIPIKKIDVKILPEEEVFVGGSPIGLKMQSDGAVVISNSIVMPETSKVVKNQNFRIGDVIKSIDGKEIHCADDIINVLQNADKDQVSVVYQNANQNKEKQVSLIKDSNGKYKIGLWVKDDFAGVGTLTFVSKEDGKNQFGALGHPITNGQNENIIPIIGGEVYSCSLVDIAKGEANNPGELRCVFVEKDKQGSFNKNTSVGIFGDLDSLSDLVDYNRTALLGGRLSVKPGKAKIVSKVSGILEEYEIEIIKTAYQSKSADKSLVFRVTDKRLLKLTGGIVQGMSGSPIIQNDKIVGAVTHVFVSDPTKGYGVYSDWMLENLE